jgi:hypothetical protein
MKLQAHLPTVSSGARDSRAVTIALALLLAAAVLLLATESGALLNNPLLEHLPTSSAARPQVAVLNRVSLNILPLNNPIDPTIRFSVAHPLPANVASSQPFSIGMESRLAFEVFGETAQSELVADERTLPELQQRNDRVMLMLMLLRLHQHSQ